MPTATKRRKVATAPQNAVSFASKPRGIGAFTKVSKVNSITTKSIIDKTALATTITVKPTKPQKSAGVGEKRKASEFEEEDESEHEVTQILAFARRTREVKSLLPTNANKSQPSPQTPRKAAVGSKSNSVDTPTKGARGLLGQLHLASRTPTRSSLNPKPARTPLLDLNTPLSSQDTTVELPTELLDLINLHAAFLTALSLHYAHNGTNSPADLRMLCPNVARVWGKRRVTLEDIQRILGVLNSGISRKPNDDCISHLTLSDYGHGKICIEISITGGKGGRIARPINEDLMNRIFVQEMKTCWEEKSASNLEAKQFISALPLESITTCTSLIKGAAVLAKGQRRLEEFKVGISIMKEQEEAKVQEAERLYKSGAKPTLLERLRAKQMEKANAPPPPTKEELARKGAMQKVEEVAAVLTILSTSSSVGQQRISFTLPTVLGRLQDSLNTPISKSEGEACVRLLAAEIAPEWVKVVRMGRVDALVVNRDERPTEANILKRIEQAA